MLLNGMRKDINFLGAKELKVIEALIDGEYYIRELAEKLKIAPSTVFRVVKKLVKVGMVTTKKEKNKKIALLNRKNVLTKQIISFIFIYKIMRSEGFKELKKQSKSGGVYGSVVDGTMDKLSDIDLWILSEKKPSMLEIGKIRSKLNNELGKEISIKTFTKESIERLKQEDKIFFNELYYKSKTLHGEEIE